jgi:Photoprotection regulator fluorescence recovery protein
MEPVDFHNLKWSPPEKSIARKAYDAAQQRELDTIIRKAKEMALGIKTPSELWKLEDYLFESRKKIDSKYDYRYSVLPLLFAQLVREGWLKEEELDGLREEKLAYLRLLHSFSNHTATQ